MGGRGCRPLVPGRDVKKQPGRKRRGTRKGERHVEERDTCRGKNLKATLYIEEGLDRERHVISQAYWQPRFSRFLQDYSCIQKNDFLDVDGRDEKDEDHE